MDGEENDLRILGVVNWSTNAQLRDGYKKFLEQIHEGL
jgi:hypothetical protein